MSYVVFSPIPQPGNPWACDDGNLPAFIRLVQELGSVGCQKVLWPVFKSDINMIELYTCNTKQGNCPHDVIDHRFPRCYIHGSSSTQPALQNRSVQCPPCLTFIESQQRCSLTLVENCAVVWMTRRPTNKHRYSSTIIIMYSPTIHSHKCATLIKTTPLPYFSFLGS